VGLSPPTRAQLLAAVTYIHADRPIAARDFRTRVEAVLLRLMDFPASGRAIPGFDRLVFREVMLDSYRLFYRIQGNLIVQLDRLSVKADFTGRFVTEVRAFRTALWKAVGGGAQS